MKELSDDRQTTSRSLSASFLTDAERHLFDFLKNGPRRYSEIKRHLMGKKISESKSNDLLNKNVEEHRLFRIQKGTQVFYRINDFPYNIKALLVFLDHIIKGKKVATINLPSKKEGESLSESIARMTFQYLYEIPKNKQELVFYQALKRNIVRLYPKLDLRKIAQFTIAEISASASGNQSLLTFIEGLKNTLD